MTTFFAIPAFEAEHSIADVVGEVLALCAEAQLRTTVVVVDDGSKDGTRERARLAGAKVLTHPHNRGKGAALRTALTFADSQRATMLVTLDADGQHFPRDAVRLALHPAPSDTLVLGVRNPERSHAPRLNRVGNEFSNLFVSCFSCRVLSDTQCGLRRYPVQGSLALGVRANGFAFEAELVLRAARAGLPITESPVGVRYTERDIAESHFHVLWDPLKIASAVTLTALTAWQR